MRRCVMGARPLAVQLAQLMPGPPPTVAALLLPVHLAPVPIELGIRAVGVGHLAHLAVAVGALWSTPMAPASGVAGISVAGTT